MQLDGLSSIKYSFSLQPFAGEPQRKALVVSFCGRIGSGTTEELDARFMQAVATAGVIRLVPSAVVLDFRLLDMDGVGQIYQVLEAARRPVTHAPLPLCVIAKKCHGALVEAIAYALQLRAEECVAWTLDDAMRLVQQSATKPTLDELSEVTHRLWQKMESLTEKLDSIDASDSPSG